MFAMKSAMRMPRNQARNYVDNLMRVRYIGSEGKSLGGTVSEIAL